MAILSDLPNELLIGIWGYVIEPEDVESFALISKRVYGLAKPFVEEHTRLKQQYSKIRVQPGHPAADLLNEILLNPRIALYINELQTGIGRILDMDNTPHITYSQDTMNLFTKAIRSCSFIAPSEVTDWVASMDSGDEDPILALIVMRLTKLKRLDLFPGAKGRLLRTLDRMTQSSEACICPGSSVLSCVSDLRICHDGFDSDQLSRLLRSMKELKSFSYFPHCDTWFELFDALPPYIEKVNLHLSWDFPSDTLQGGIRQMVMSKKKRLTNLEALTFKNYCYKSRDMELITQLVGKCAEVGVLLSYC